MDFSNFFMEYWAEFLLTLISGGLIFLIKIIYKRMIALNNGIQSLLRDRMIQLYNYSIDKGYCPIYKKENFINMYENYHALGGNGTVTKLKDTLMNLPTEPPQDHDYNDHKDSNDHYEYEYETYRNTGRDNERI